MLKSGGTAVCGILFSTLSSIHTDVAHKDLAWYETNFEDMSLHFKDKECPFNKLYDVNFGSKGTP